MILYLDTSALVPLIIEEPSSPVTGEIWDTAEHLVVMRLVYVETVAAMAMAKRNGRVTNAQAREGREILDALWSAVDILELDRNLMIEAAKMADGYGLKGFDAVHCAAAVLLNGPNLLAASGDQKLLGAWRSEKVSVCDTNA